jgi:hypothetical protein
LAVVSILELGCGEAGKKSAAGDDEPDTCEPVSARSVMSWDGGLEPPQIAFHEDSAFVALQVPALGNERTIVRVDVDGNETALVEQVANLVAFAVADDGLHWFERDFQADATEHFRLAWNSDVPQQLLDDAAPTPIVHALGVGRDVWISSAKGELWRWIDGSPPVAIPVATNLAPYAQLQFHGGVVTAGIDPSEDGSTLRAWSPEGELVLLPWSGVRPSSTATRLAVADQQVVIGYERKDSDEYEIVATPRTDGTSRVVYDSAWSWCGITHGYYGLDMLTAAGQSVYWGSDNSVVGVENGRSELVYVGGTDLAYPQYTGIHAMFVGEDVAYVVEEHPIDTSTSWELVPLELSRP